MKKILFLDTETTGLPTFDEHGQMPCYKFLKAYDPCRLLQVGGVLAYEDGTIYQTLSLYIKNNEPFFNHAQHVNGISERHIQQYGFDIDHVLSNLALVINEVDIIVIQRVEFDANVILSELQRLNIDNGYYVPNVKNALDNAFCTKKFFTQYFKDNNLTMKHERGASLSEIFLNITNRKFPENTHDALVDARMLYDIYFDAKSAKIL